MLCCVDSSTEKMNAAASLCAHNNSQAMVQKKWSRLGTESEKSRQELFKELLEKRNVIITSY